MYSKGLEAKKVEKRSSGMYNQDTKLNKVLSQHTVQPDPDLLQRTLPDKRLMNGKGSPSAKDLKRANSRTSKTGTSNVGPQSAKARQTSINQVNQRAKF